MQFILDKDELLIENGIFVLYFYAPWIFLNNKMLDCLSEAEKIFPQIKFYGIDVESLVEFIKLHNLSSLPTAEILLNGERMKKIVGIQNIYNITSILSDIEKMSKSVNIGEKENDKTS